jgi:hypothetical protein
MKTKLTIPTDLLKICVPGVLAACVAGAQTGCGSAPDGTSSEATGAEAAPLYDGETIFRGLFFGAGPVAQYLPEVWENPFVIEARADALRASSAQSAAAKLERTSADLAAAGEMAHATQAADIAKQLRGLPPDHLLAAAQPADIQRAQDEMIAFIQSTDPTFLGRFGHTLQSGDRIAIAQILSEGIAFFSKATTSGPSLTAPGQGGHGLFVGPVAVIVIAVAVTVVAVTYGWYWFGIPADGLVNGSGLQRDVMVDRLADRLSVAGRLGAGAPPTAPSLSPQKALP